MASQWSQIARKRKSAKIVNADFTSHFDGNTSFFGIEGGINRVKYLYYVRITVF